jgi:hypothetical protein
MKILIVSIVFHTLFFLSAVGQEVPQPDTVVIAVGDASRVIFDIRNPKDLQTLKQYDLQAVVNELTSKLEKRDTRPVEKTSQDFLKDEQVYTLADDEAEHWDQDGRHNKRRYRYYSKRTYQSFNVDLGTNNYLTEGKFPDNDNYPFTVRPWGSWYVGLAITQRTRITRILFLEWSGGVSWYNFKFQNERVIIQKDDEGITFPEDPRDLDYKKSKLTVSYVNFFLVPVLDFGEGSSKGMIFDGRNNDSFRVGFGPYVGYRIDSYTKQVYKENGDKEKDHNHDNFYLNNLRYGLRLQLGIEDIDVFVNYDLNDMFVAGRGPQLNAFSFGITF